MLKRFSAKYPVFCLLRGVDWVKRDVLFTFNRRFHLAVWGC